MAETSDLLVTISTFDDSINGKEALDAVLAFAVFDIPIDVFFTSEGVKQLSETLSNIDGGNNLAKQWASASLYGVEKLLVCEDDMAKYPLSAQILDDITPISAPPNAANYKHQLKF